MRFLEFDERLVISLDILLYSLRLSFYLGSLLCYFLGKQRENLQFGFQKLWLNRTCFVINLRIWLHVWADSMKVWNYPIDSVYITEECVNMGQKCSRLENPIRNVWKDNFINKRSWKDFHKKIVLQHMLLLLLFIQSSSQNTFQRKRKLQQN